MPSWLSYAFAIQPLHCCIVQKQEWWLNTITRCTPQSQTHRAFTLCTLAFVWSTWVVSDFKSFCRAETTCFLSFTSSCRSVTACVRAAVSLASSLPQQALPQRFRPSSLLHSFHSAFSPSPGQIFACCWCASGYSKEGESLLSRHYNNTWRRERSNNTPHAQHR